MRRKKAMTRTELPIALHVVLHQHTSPVTRILVPGRSILNQMILNITIELSHKPHAPDVV